MKLNPKISEAEWEVMKVLWGRAPQNAAEVAHALQGRTGWKLNTVKTLLARLVGKGALAAEKIGREHHYTPLLSETECAVRESRSFLQRVYDGARLPMIAQLLSDEKLSADEIAELRRLLDQMENRR